MSLGSRKSLLGVCLFLFYPLFLSSWEEGVAGSSAGVVAATDGQVDAEYAGKVLTLYKYKRSNGLVHHIVATSPLGDQQEHYFVCHDHRFKSSFADTFVGFLPAHIVDSVPPGTISISLPSEIYLRTYFPHDINNRSMAVICTLLDGSVLLGRYVFYSRQIDLIDNGNGDMPEGKLIPEAEQVDNIIIVE